MLTALILIFRTVELPTRWFQVQTDTYAGAEIDCLMCGQPLQTGDGDSFFKYFLVDPSWLSRQQLLALHHDTLHHDDVCKLRGARQ